MTAGEWIASGIGCLIIGGLVHLVWILSRMKALLESHVVTNEGEHTAIWKKLDGHDATLANHGERLAGLEARE